MVGAVAIPYFISFAKQNGLAGETRSVVKLALVCISMSFLMAVVYVQAAQAGLLTQKSKMQLSSIKNPYNPVELIWSGRAGTIIGIVGALDRPVFGFGSMTFETTRFFEARRREPWQILHSVIVESMVYGGLITLVAWIFLLKYLLTLYPSTPMQYGLVSLVHIIATTSMVTIAWTLLFSPLVSVRLDTPLYVALLVYCSRETSGVVK